MESLNAKCKHIYMQVYTHTYIYIYICSSGQCVLALIASENQLNATR